MYYLFSALWFFNPILQILKVTGEALLESLTQAPSGQA
jgi:hypothetical protein